jgi:mRNA interferase MazF
VGSIPITRSTLYFVPLEPSGLPHDSVVNVSQLITLDKEMLTENVGRLPGQILRDVEAGIRLVLAL